MWYASLACPPRAVFSDMLRDGCGERLQPLSSLVLLLESSWYSRTYVVCRGPGSLTALRVLCGPRLFTCLGCRPRRGERRCEIRFVSLVDATGMQM